MDHESPYVVALRSAIDAIGSQAAFANRIGVTQQAVSRWVRGSKALPAEHVLMAEAATGVPKEALRPDIYPPEDGPPPPFSAEPHRTDDPAPGPAAALDSPKEVTPSAKTDAYDGAHS